MYPRPSLALQPHNSMNTCPLPQAVNPYLNSTILSLKAVLSPPARMSAAAPGMVCIHAVQVEPEPPKGEGEAETHGAAGEMS